MIVGRRTAALKIILVVASVIGAAATAGVLRGMVAEPGGGPFGRLPWITEGQAQVQDPIVTERGLAQVEAPDPALRFPDPLRDLPASPYDLAVDQSGALWFVLFDGPAGTNTLSRYDPASSDLKTFAIPRSNGSGMVSVIDVDERGHVIWAEGDLVLDFDPATESDREIRLPPPSNPAFFIPFAGTYITAMGLDGNGHAYLSRMNFAALTDIDLETGAIREIPYPLDFGPVHDLAAANDTVWVTNPYDMEHGPSAQSGKIDVNTGSYEAIEGVPAVFARGSGETLYGTSFAAGGLATVEGRLLSPVAAAGGALSKLGVPDGDVVVVDRRSGRLWASNGIVKVLIAFDPASQSVTTFALGTYLTTPVSCPLPPVGQPDTCGESIEVSPQVTGLAVARNGDLYFSDSAFNRIGVIHAGQ